MIWIQGGIVVLSILVGTRLQGIGLGLMGGMGLAVLTFGFHVPPTEPPLQVLMIIISVVTASGILELAGGLRLLTALAEQFIKRYPQRITFISPLLVYVLTVLSGTGHTIYSILPVIADTARDVGVRPEKPLSASVIASQQAALASPISAPTVLLISILAPHGVKLLDVLKVLIPATAAGVIAATAAVHKFGKGFTPILGSSSVQRHVDTPSVTLRHNTDKRVAASIFIFLMGVAAVMFLGAAPTIRPSWRVQDTIQIMDMPSVIEIAMLATAALIVCVCRVDPRSIAQSRVFVSGMQAVISIMGIAWLGDTFISAHQTTILEAVRVQVLEAPWQFGLMLFGMSVLLVSQSATLRAMLPLGIVIGLPIPMLLAAVPAVNGLFFLPNYPTLLAAINFDTTGSTSVGKYVLNHSFMMPGLIATLTSVVTATLLTKVVF